MLQDGLIASAARAPTADAVVAPEGRASYGALDALANRIARYLQGEGVVAGDRVALWLEKSVASVAAMQAVLRLGAAYVPVDPMAPLERARVILEDCAVRAIVSTSGRLARLEPAGFPQAVTVAADGSDWNDLLALSADPLPPVVEAPGSLAYILYTSGSTGTPKGVCVSHAGALAFVDWAIAAAGLGLDDRLANHAPFHFDLSVFDLYGAFATGACVVLLPDHAAFVPSGLVDAVVGERISVWYSVPSALILMSERGGLHALRDSSLRVIFFAGEPFPIHQLRPLRAALPHVRFLNLYGPTETNVCTAHEVGEIAPASTSPVPIGGAVCGNRVWAQTAEGGIAEIGEEGELIVDGPTVMLGYWGRDAQAGQPYATGDIVRRLDADSYLYLGRQDGMLKVRGYRIGAGEVEAALVRHPAVRECAVTTRGSGLAAKLVACLVCEPDGRRPTLLSVKAHLAQHVPRYMIVDSLAFLDSMPRNRNGKLDRRHLAALVTTQEQDSP